MLEMILEGSLGLMKSSVGALGLCSGHKVILGFRDRPGWSSTGERLMPR